MKIYLTRHGQVPNNVLKNFANDEDDLTEIGIRQAEELRDKLKDINFDIVISSPLKRAIHTTKIIVGNDRNIIIDDRIRERINGSLCGKPYNVTNRNEYWNYYTDIKYGTSEDIRDFFKRVHDFIDELKTKDYENVLIVTHSGVTKAFESYFEGIKDGKFLDRGLKNCEVKEYNYEIEKIKSKKNENNSS